MLNSALIFVIICLVLILGIVSAHYKNYKKKMSEIKSIYDGDWELWSDIKYLHMPAGRDMYNGEYVPESTRPYQERYHTVTGEYQRRYI